MEVWYLSAATVVFSVLGAAMVCGLTFGRLQGKVDGMNYRLDKIEKEHTTVMTGLSSTAAKLEEMSKMLIHINDHWDNFVTKEDLARIEVRLDLAIAGKTNRLK